MSSVLELPDIDIDVANRSAAVASLENFRIGSRVQDGVLESHNSGIYFQDIPIDLVSGLSAIPFREAENHGFVKVDILPRSVYEPVIDRDDLARLVRTEPDWSLLLNSDAVSKLDQLSSHPAVLHQLRPSSVLELAAAIAIIRPGKKYLLGETWDTIHKKIWEPEPDGYQFKKSHAVAYAFVVIMQLNLIKEGRL